MDNVAINGVHGIVRPFHFPDFLLLSSLHSI